MKINSIYILFISIINIHKVLSFDYNDDYIIFHEELDGDDYNYIIEEIDEQKYFKIIDDIVLDEDNIFE